ncbi:SDR family NAD(P)-dependent oxidoreductase [Streptomyces violarus]|uniref:SDR family NAD(P)-dependent oxidoreductase n=1 Tax=Streptomyces violarus TaxID=67380 RepID=UPI0021BFB55D|nr:SDR family NAD(P)-dependent oxidoreductase [Streptomyces violarus]MCT9143894.1 SDR family NAD(P)-dependent oxidoreductase [Streptomyces violarus]
MDYGVFPSIAIVGAGPQIDLAIARPFGSQGFDVALISRNRDKLDDLVGKPEAEGIDAAAFPANVLDRAGLTRAIESAAAKYTTKRDQAELVFKL